MGRFVYDKRWSKKSEMMELVRKGWNELYNNNFVLVLDRIALCRKAIVKWKRREVSNSKKMIDKFRVEFEEEEKKVNFSMSRMIYFKFEFVKLF